MTSTHARPPTPSQIDSTTQYALPADTEGKVKKDRHSTKILTACKQHVNARRVVVQEHAA